MTIKVNVTRLEDGSLHAAVDDGTNTSELSGTGSGHDHALAAIEAHRERHGAAGLPTISITLGPNV